jgi:hypothetical protein
MSSDSPALFSKMEVSARSSSGSSAAAAAMLPGHAIEERESTALKRTTAIKHLRNITKRKLLLIRRFALSSYRN